MTEMDYKTFFKGKKITLMGLGLLGRGAGDARFLAECGAELIVTDLKTREQLASSLSELAGFKNITFVLGEHRLQDFENRDLIIKAAGVPLDSVHIAHAKKCGIPIEMSTALFARLSGATIVGITGTRGKTTTTHLIYEGLKKSGKKVFLGGNVQGVSTLALLPEVTKGDVVVLELDSWQLQGFGPTSLKEFRGASEAGISPHVAVFTNLLVDHMNYYKDDMESYFKDKANIFLYQQAGDVLVAGKVVAEKIKKHMPENHPSVIIEAPPMALPHDWELKLLGTHNRENATLAFLALKSLGLSSGMIRSTFENFTGVAGRLEFVREIHGVKIYNDTTATTPDATLAGLRALADTHRKNIVLIFGGADKGLDMSSLLSEIPKYCKAVVMLPGTGTQKLLASSLKLIGENEPKPFLKAISYQLSAGAVQVENLTDTVSKALALAKAGDTILFSPAFASFGMFKNEYDRGEQFLQKISEL